MKGNGKISEYIEEESIWTGDDESVEDAQQDVWSISSDSLLIAVLDHEEENDIHLSDELLHFSMILSKGAASWYQSVADARASNKWPHQYRVLSMLFVLCLLHPVASCSVVFLYVP